MIDFFSIQALLCHVSAIQFITTPALPAPSPSQKEEKITNKWGFVWCFNPASMYF